MCGILGYVGDPADTLDVVIDGLSTLEYRGYDSAGVAVANISIEVVKQAGELDVLTDSVAAEAASMTGPVGIGHTRWSTHGAPTDANAHPHRSEDGSVAVVHNGIIDNYQPLRDELEAQGTTFTSETDTEVVPHLLSSALDSHPPEIAFRQTMKRLEGSYAIAAVIAGEDRIFAARNDSPLVLGINDGTYYLASDVPAFLNYTRDVVYLENGDIAILATDGWQVTDLDGTLLNREVSTVTWSAEDTGKSGYDHFMLKEINEQPEALRQCLSGRINELDGTVQIAELTETPLPNAIQLVACGTSYHAALYAADIFRTRGLPATAFLANEYATRPAPVTPETLVVGVTQSGETADTLSALREAQGRGARTLVLTNVVGSTAARECDDALYIRSGPEIGVAATKTFSSQLVTANILVNYLTQGYSHTNAIHDHIDALRDLPDQLTQILDSSIADAIVEEYADSRSYFFIGRGLNFPVALEGALKFKEITYEHAEGFAAGELKHGPLALITETTPIFAIVTGSGDRTQKTIGNVKEVKARDAPVIAVTDRKSEIERYADHILDIPATDIRTAPMLANVQLQLVAYHMANRLGRSIDKPRNLAKSVTVE